MTKTNTKKKKMKDGDFYKMYADTPLNDRFIPLNFNKGGLTNLATIKQHLDNINEQIQGLESQKEEMLELAGDYCKKN